MHIFDCGASGGSDAADRRRHSGDTPMTDIISDMPIDDRPRERLLAHGPRSLSDAELLGILLGCGAAGKNAVQLARELLPGGVGQLATRQPAQLTRYRGMGTAKAARIAAAFELARRAA